MFKGNLMSIKAENKVLPHQSQYKTRTATKYQSNEPQRGFQVVSKESSKFLPRNVDVKFNAANFDLAAAPAAPGVPVVTVSSNNGVSASWVASPSSAISYYAFGIGLTPTGDYGTLATVRWWQVSSYDTSASVSLMLDASLTYYFSVYVVNTAGLSSPIVTSLPFKSNWQNLGNVNNKLHVKFRSMGYDTSGNVIAGWTNNQILQMSTFVKLMVPIIEELYGPPCDNYTVTVVRDLAYSSSNIFIPSTGEIR